MQIDRFISIGDAVGMSVRHVRRDIPFLFRKLLVPSLVELGGKVLLVVAARMILEASLKTAGFPDLSAVLLVFVGIFITLPAELWLTMIQLGYVRQLVLARDSFEQAYKEVKGRWWQVLIYAVIFYFVFLFWVFLWTFFFAFSAIIAKASPITALVVLPLMLIMIALALVSLVVLLLPLCILFAVIACEDNGFWNVIARSANMSFKRLWLSLGFLLLSGITYAIIYFVMTSPLQILYAFFYYGDAAAGHRVSEASIPLYVHLIGSVWHSLIYIFLMPIHYLSSGFYYYILRMRVEGQDIVSGIDKLEAPKRALNG